MKDMLAKHETLDYFDSAEDTPSIVSIKVKHWPPRAWMVKDELAKVFKAMTLDMSETFPDEPIAKERCFIGQPVFISDEFSILRLALGSDSLRQIIDDIKNKTIFITDTAMESDRIILRKMDFLAKNFEEYD